MTQELILVAVAFLTAAMTGLLGAGGGALMLAVMSSFLAPTVVIPLHGVIQFGSNFSRASLSYPSIQWRVFMIFALGAVLGSYCGSLFIFDVSPDVMRRALGVFILLVVWMPKLETARKIPGKFFVVGAGSGFLTLFLGATGPLVAPFFVREKWKKLEILSSLAACMAIQHLTKVVTYAYRGFDFAPHLKLLGMMMVGTVAGAYAGKHLVERLPERAFLWGFRITVTVLALKMLIEGAGA